MLLLLVEVKDVLDFVDDTLALGGLAVAAVLLLVDVAGSTALRCSQWCARCCMCCQTYASVELVLALASVDLRDEVD
jgi:hypothetical protein